MEAIILAGGKAERLGHAAGGRPKALVRVAGRPLAAYQVARLASAGVERVIVSCAAGQGPLFERELAGLGAEIVTAEEPERLGRGGGIRFAAGRRLEQGDIYALNGDELLDVDFEGLLARHRTIGAAATIAVARPLSPFGIVEVGDGDAVTGFSEGGRMPTWVNCGIYVLGEEALARFPERGDHEASTFPELAAEGRLRAFRHEGLWLTVNTPKDLRRAEEHVAAHPDWLGPAGLLGSPGTMDDQLSSPNLGGLDAFAFESRRIEKPWGWELIWAVTDQYVGKVLFVLAGHALSLQFHREKDESWYLYEGRAELEIGTPGDAIPNSEVVGPGAAFRLLPGTVHRVRAIEDTVLLEASTPHLDDVVRLEDRYGRA